MQLSVPVIPEPSPTCLARQALRSHPVRLQPLPRRPQGQVPDREEVQQLLRGLQGTNRVEENPAVDEGSVLAEPPVRHQATRRRLQQFLRW